ncbi:ABC transporter substrate-binding protein [Allorhizocola rhizosphaerae]|uniref:ABC transporter substrate-binding protein n=1 Tax=Allorhizocola rhizosphaerae TaxID=1872709 RepID=UPI0013C2E18A|nr:extracellular solute-binding protein [Allorhizocola rhizosphaerae]
MAKLARWVLAAAVVAAATGCAPGGAPADGNITLNVWGWRTEDVAAYNKIFERYEKNHPGVNVEYRAFKNTEYNTILLTGLAGDAGPDLAQLRAYGELQPSIASGGLLALDGQIEALKSFPSSTLDGVRSKDDGKVYGVPFAIQTMHVIYNKKLFAAHAIAPPATWQDMTAGADTLQSAGVTPFAVTVRDDWMLPIEHEIFGAGRYGGPDFRERLLRGNAKFTDPDYVASIELYAGTTKYWQPKFSGVGYDDAKALFASGKAAMFPGGVWELAEFRRAVPDIEMGIFNVPPPPDAKVNKTLTPGFVDGSFGVSSRTPRQAQALELARWMASAEFGQAFSDELTQISAVPGTTPTDPLLKQAFEGFRANPGPYLMYGDFGYGTPSGAELLRAGLADVLLGRKSAADVASGLQRGVEQWFRPRG